MKAAPSIRAIAVLFLSALAFAENPAGSGNALESLERFYPAEENSPEEKGLVDRISEEARRMGYDTRVVSAGLEDRWHSYSRTLICSFRGDSSDAIVFAAPLNAPAELSGGAASALPAALLLGLMADARRKWPDKPPLSLDFAFIGDEYPVSAAFPDGRPRCGSDALAESLPQDRRNAVVYIDIRGTDFPLKLVNHSSRVVSPYRIFQVLSKSLSRRGISYLHRGAFNQFYRAGLVVDEKGPRPRSASGRIGGAASFLDRGIPAIELVSAPGPVNASRIEAVLGSLISFIEDNSEGLNQSWDRHYLVIDLPYGTTALRERDFVVFVLIAISLVLCLFFTTSLTKRQQLSSLMRGFGRDFWALPLSVVFCLAAVWASSEAMGLVLMLKGAPDAWMSDQIVHLILRQAIVIGLLSVVFSAGLALRILPSTISLYSAGSALLFFIDVFIASTIDVSLSLYFAWASLCCIAAIMLRSKPATLVLLIAGLAPLAALLILSAWVPGIRMRGVMIRPSFAESLVLVFLYLPMVFYVIRAILILRRSHDSPPLSRTLPVLITGSLGALAVLAFIALRPPYAPSRPQPIAIVDRFDSAGSGVMTVAGPGTLSRIILTRDGESSRLSGYKRQKSRSRPGRNPPLSALIHRPSSRGNGYAYP
jgi:hypothetical protein